MPISRSTFAFIDSKKSAQLEDVVVSQFGYLLNVFSRQIYVKSNLEFDTQHDNNRVKDSQQSFRASNSFNVFKPSHFFCLIIEREKKYA